MTASCHLPASDSPRPPAGGVRYAELHCLSNFSFLRGASHPGQLVRRAAELGYEALALTDRHSLAGVVRAHEAACECGLHLLIGAEIHPVGADPLVLLAPDRAAYGRLARLLTRGKLRTSKGRCEIHLDDIAELAGGLIAIALTTASGDQPPAETDSPTAAAGTLSRYKDIFADRLYLAVELDRRLADETRLRRQADLAARVGVPLVAANNVYYHAPQQRYLQDVLTCIRLGCTLAQAGTRLCQNAERHLRPLDEIARRYRGYEAALARTVEIARRCTFRLDELRYEYPHEVCPAGMTPIEYLRRLTWAGAARRSGLRAADAPAALPAALRARLEAELNLIAELGYEHYFLTVYDLVRFARSRGILCQGRGSAANSAVCYCLGITAVDPRRIDLLFERFISRERAEPPDIDVDFEHQRREEVFQYIYRKYGRERAAITAEVITYRPRSAIRDVGKVLGLSRDCVDALARAREWSDREPLPEEIIRHVGLDPRDRTVRMLVRLVERIVGFPRHLSQHVGGFVITESPLCEIVPLENAAMPGRTFIEWDKDDIDALGILKVDCLALGMLTAISKCFRLLRSLQRDAGTKGRRDEGLGANDRDAESAPVRSVQPGAAAKSAGTVIHYEHCVARESRHARNPDISRPDRMAKSDSACQKHLPDHSAVARGRTLRPDRPDAPGRRLDSEQHRRRKRPPDTPRLSPFPVRGTRLTGRAGNATHHRSGLEHAGERGCGHAASPGSRSHPSGPDSKSSGRFPLAPPSLRPCAPASLCPSIPASPNPLFPSCLADIPPEDPAVYDMICRADTVGVFQIESRAQMSMLPRLRPRCFYDLVIEVAIVRPGPIQGGMVHPYLRRRNGCEPVTYPGEAVREVLAKTLGVPLFQEQVMRLAVVAAGFTPGEADQLRRAMAAWRRSGKMQQFQRKLVQGMLQNGYSVDFAEQIYRQISGFAEYGFPESHAASFALLVYASAWLKCYHPAAFCAAMINAQPLGFYTPGQLLRDAIAHGVTVLPIDVNASDYDCTLEPRAPGGPALRLGMRLVRGLSAEKVREIIAARREGPIRAIRQLALRNGVSRETLLRLAAADAFRSLGLGRREALWRILAAGSDRESLFAGLEPAEPPVALPRAPTGEAVVQDYDAVGFSLRAHPIGLLRAELDAQPATRGRPRIVPAGHLRRLRHGEAVAVAGLVTLRQRPGTAGGITFVTLEDETGLANLVIRPNVWQRHRLVAHGATALIAEGRLERQGEVVHVLVRQLADLGKQLSRLRHRSRDFH